MAISILLQHKQLRNNTYYIGTKFILHCINQRKKAKFKGNNGYFLYLYNISDKEITNCDVVCYRGKEREVNSPTLLRLNQ